MNVVREIVKLLMFAILWSLPLATSAVTGKSTYWLYIVSVIGSFIMFSHYESFNDRKGNNDGTTQG